MDYKPEQYVGNPNDIFDIPAAEQEITVGSNEQTILSNSLISPASVMSSSPAPAGSIVISAPMGLHNTNQAPRPPRVIMLQRTGQNPAFSIAGAPQRPTIKTVKIITVPGQGAGGKPLKAAVIPMHMLQRSMKVVSSGGASFVSCAQPGTPSVPRLLTIRAPSQLSLGGTVLSPSNVSTVRPGTIFLSTGGGTAPMVSGIGTMYQSSDDIENNMLPSMGVGDGVHVSHGGLLSTAAQGPYYDLSVGLPTPTAIPGYMQPSSPGRESGDEQEQIPTGLKTNGLRRYARCVCDKVKEKGITSYSEVADELVHEYAAEHPMIPSEQLHYIQKNIRRRVYDALNVLMALNVLQKEKKEIRWVGLPVNMIEECRRLEEEREKSQIALRNKTVEIQDLILQLIAFKNLVMRNRINDRYRRSQSSIETQAPGDNGTSGDLHLQGFGPGGNMSKTRTEKIPLPFLVISTHRKTVIDCNISNDKLEYLFNFDQAFEIRDEVDTLKRMGLMLRLGTIHCTQEEYNQCLELVPPSLRFYVEAIYERRQAIVPDFEALHQQRRLFVEARLAAAAANQAAGQTHEHGESMGPGGAGLRNSQHTSMDHGSHYGGLFDGGCPPSESTLRQLYLSRSVDDSDDGHLVSSSSGVPSSGFVPGDTQHYARAAASRGFVVPGGPGGLLRHRQHPGSTGRQFVAGERTMHTGSTGNSSNVNSLICSVGAGSCEDVSAAAALTAGPSTNHRVSRCARPVDDLMDDDDLMGEHEEDDDDEDEDDEDMEEV
ncbi:hypothetical protein EG68_04387 [Paragonimus skrjabini miyazakii]|uniref:Transcription factor Dp-1 n=1 Tax=Paragonimus skrjabini miyazakii TaxID=59628 RepID=A0A8S9Z4B4_9TREM|nr:hypothetical protein EG68_04387 [Paragonimus skrjabini miyazakii]